MQQRSKQNERIELIIGHVLRAGLFVAVAVTSVGGALYLFRHGNSQPQYRTFAGEPAVLRSVHGIVHEALLLDSRAMIQLGLLILILTPVMRVAASILAFARQRDWTFVALTSIVLVILTLSLLGIWS